MLVIRNTVAYTMEQNQPLEDVDILCEGGRIKSVGHGLAAGLTEDEDTHIIDGKGLYVTPGLIDAHTHTGIGMLDGEGQDANEMIGAVLPQMNILSSIDIQADDFKALHKEGVTSVCVIPGSGNVIGGQGLVMKTAGMKGVNKGKTDGRSPSGKVTRTPKDTAESLVVKNPVVMKCAMGGNPKNYRVKGQMPETRMGVAFLLRDTLRQAKEYMEKKDAAADDSAQMPPYDAKLEALIPVLRREIPLKVHCEQFDMVTLIRIAKEFNCNYCIEHAWLCSQYADELVDGGGSICFGPIGIPEGYGEVCGGDVAQVRELDERGLNVSLVTDYPLLADNVLLIQAGEAVRYGVPHDRALRMITINPAKSFGLDDRLGSIVVGKDADLVVWSAIPALETAATPLYTIIDGEVVYKK